MTLDVSIAVDRYSNIRITVPDTANKENIAGNSTSQLHALDIATAEYIGQKTCITLYTDTIGNLTYFLYIALVRSIAEVLTIPHTVDPGTIGRFINILDNRVCDVWIRRAVRTMLYNRDNSIYLEIIPLYPWRTVEPKSHEHYIPFSTFLQQYEAYVIHSLTWEVAIQWRDTCYDILCRIGDESDIPTKDTIIHPFI